MTKVVLAVVGLVVLGGVLITAGRVGTASPAVAATGKITVTGTVVADVKDAQPGQPVTFQFKVDNATSSTFNYIESYYLTNSTFSSTECVLSGSRLEINTDGLDTCEPNPLPAHTTNESAITVIANGGTSISVEACAGNTSASKTYCGTVKVPLDD
jgi:hypothetical protein